MLVELNTDDKQRLANLKKTEGNAKVDKVKVEAKPKVEKAKVAKAPVDKTVKKTAKTEN